MESAILGLVLDSSLLIAAERNKLSAAEAVRNFRQAVGELPLVISSVSIAEVGHGIYRAPPLEIRQRRRAYLDQLKGHIPVHPISDATAEIVARIDGEQAAIGINLPFADLLIGACALELNYTIATRNPRDFTRIPGLEVITL